MTAPFPYFDCEKLLTDLIRDEGLKLRPYVDTVGKITIGIGRNLSDCGISEAEARLLARNDIAARAAELDRAILWWRDLSPARQQALMNMAFNMGWPRLAGFKVMLAALEHGDFVSAKLAALDSTWANQVGMRAVRIAEVFEEG